MTLLIHLYVHYYQHNILQQTQYHLFYRKSRIIEVPLMKYLKKSYLLENDILLALINIENEYWVLLVLYPILGKAVYFYSLLSFSDISEKIQPLFPCINCYCKLHNIEKNWKILVHNLTPQ